MNDRSSYMIFLRMILSEIPLILILTLRVDCQPNTQEKKG
jgi:hypothetical protein